MKIRDTDHCTACGMPCDLDYHPYAACVLYRQLGQSDKVKSNLDTVLKRGAEDERARIIAMLREPEAGKIACIAMMNATPRSSYLDLAGIALSALADHMEKEP